MPPWPPNAELLLMPGAAFNRPMVMEKSSGVICSMFCDTARVGRRAAHVNRWRRAADFDRLGQRRDLQRDVDERRLAEADDDFARLGGEARAEVHFQLVGAGLHGDERVPGPWHR